jgi:hypothetical protein
MTLTYVLAAGLMAATISGAQPAEPNEQNVRVYFSDGTLPLVVVAQARHLAGRMFAGIGVKIEWRSGEPSRRRGDPAGIVVTVVDEAPVGFDRGVMAAAFPYEGIHIRIFHDRLKAHKFVDQSKLLAHILVHEITHILEGTDHHSATGIMKACWSRSDFEQMNVRPLSFAPEDVSLILTGLMPRLATRAETEGGANGGN